MTEFRPDARVYLQSLATLAAVFMAAGMAILWLIGNPHVWTGAIGGLAAVVVRGWYLRDEALGEVWTLDETALHGPGGRHVLLSELAEVKRLGSGVQLVTKGGDKHVIKFQTDPDGVVAKIKTAAPPDY
ncbi:hypothetical protein [Tropicibacter sp. S64]|uniref:hypothetical protein n=1 Tax=Tropicibacter sp. S64 TaxID=3415122 RepID=UPI003C79C20D